MNPLTINVLYTTSEKVLIATSSFSLTVSIMVEIFLFYMFCRDSMKATCWVRSVLLSILLINCIFSLSAFVFVVATNDIGFKEGVNLGSMSQRRLYPSLLSSSCLCLLVFVLSAILLFSAWEDFKDEMRFKQENGLYGFGIKGEIYL